MCVISPGIEFFIIAEQIWTINMEVSQTKYEWSESFYQDTKIKAVEVVKKFKFSSIKYFYVLID